jgi:hypothetical protein
MKIRLLAVITCYNKLFPLSPATFNIFCQFSKIVQFFLALKLDLSAWLQEEIDSNPDLNKPQTENNKLQNQFDLCLDYRRLLTLLDSSLTPTNNKIHLRFSPKILELFNWNFAISESADPDP